MDVEHSVIVPRSYALRPTVAPRRSLGRLRPGARRGPIAPLVLVGVSLRPAWQASGLGRNDRSRQHTTGGWCRVEPGATARRARELKCEWRSERDPDVGRVGSHADIDCGRPSHVFRGAETHAKLKRADLQLG